MVIVSLLAGGVLAIVATFFLKHWFQYGGTNSIPLPPGPKGLPFVGNINDLPPPEVPEYQHWLNHKERYGSLSSITTMGQTMIVIHDKDVAFELMEKRASKHSGRAHPIFGSDMCGWGVTMVMLPYGHTHRLYRKYAYQQLGSKVAVSRYNQLQEIAAGRFLWRLTNDEGKNLVQHLRTEAAEIILEILYGYSIEPHGRDPLVDLIDRAFQQAVVVLVPGKWAVDMLPFLQYVPDWMPGTGFKRVARHYKRTLTEVINVPYHFVKSRMSCAQAGPSFVAKSIDQARQEDSFGKEEEKIIKQCAASLYTGGADTSASTMVAFFLAMSMFPEVQRKAQEEIDRVVGTSSLPTSSDRERLPYVNAIVEEAQRWHPITPMGIPHAADEEDIIQGLRIPKGALLVPAVWWFTRDPATYHEPEAFKPERFLEPYNEPSATTYTFGFGRRVCPGKALADATLFVTIAQSLAALNIQKAVDSNGRPIEPEHKHGSSMIAHAGDFDVAIKPRSEAHGILIKGVVQEHPWRESDAEHIPKV